MFRIVVAALAIFGIVSLLSGEGAGAAAGFGLLLLAPVFFFFKFMFFVMLFGLFFRGFGRRRSGHHWRSDWQGRWQDEMGHRNQWMASGPWAAQRGRGSRGRRPEVDDETRRERFQEMHDLAHAKEEVESWGKYDF